MQTDSVWKKYHLEYKKKLARGEEVPTLEYGEELYCSPLVLSHPEYGKIVSINWKVMRYENEYNVFCVRWIDEKKYKKFIASFTWKEAAFKFALEMLLVCTRNVSRDDLS